MNIYEQRKRDMAHQLWEFEGKPAGQEHRHWTMACKLVGNGLEEEGGEELALMTRKVPDPAAPAKSPDPKPEINPVAPQPELDPPPREPEVPPPDNPAPHNPPVRAAKSAHAASRKISRHASKGKAR